MQLYIFGLLMLNETLNLVTHAYVYEWKVSTRKQIAYNSFS